LDPLVVRLCRSEDRQSVISLLSSEWGRRSVEEWEWMYQRVPLGSIEVVAEASGEIVGHIGMVLLNMVVVGGRALGGLAADLIVASEFRHRGISLRMWEFLMKKAKKAGVDVMYSVARQGGGAFRGALRTGWFEVGRFSEMLYLANEKLLSREIGVPLPKPLGKVVRFAFNRRKRPVEGFERGISVRVEGVERLGEEDFNPKKHCDVGVVKTPSYVSWRLARPGAEYRHLAIMEKGKRIGGVPLRIVEREGLVFAYILDVLCDLEWVISVLRSSVFFLSSQGADAIVLWSMAGSPIREKCIASGFLENPTRKASLVVGPRSKCLGNRRWCISLVDLDTV
jgi:GNAT superfamily N-acetyltransferase